MNDRNPFAEDPREFPSPPQNASAATTVLIVLAVIGGVIFLGCAGVVAMGVYMVRQTTDQFERMAAEMEMEPYGSPNHAQEFLEASASGEYERAMQATDEAIALYEDDATAHNNKAWLLATCPDERYRDGQLAVEHATKACDLTDWNHAGFLDTLAAAYAEAGDFDNAVQWQEEAITLDTDGSLGNQLQERLELYQNRTPYREPSQYDRSEEIQLDEADAFSEPMETYDSGEAGRAEPIEF